MGMSLRCSIAYWLGSAATLLLLAATPMSALAQDAGADSEQASLAEVGAKLSDPTSNVWALFTEFDLTFNDGDVNTGNAEIGGNMLFQPIMPVPLYGEGKNQWKIITRPTIPIIFSNPVPTGAGVDKFVNELPSLKL